MTTPKAEGTRVKHILGQVEQQLADNQRVLFDVALLIYGEDKRAAMEMLKPISDNNTTALRVVTLMRAGQFAQAEDVMMDARMKLKSGGKTP